MTFEEAIELVNPRVLDGLKSDKDFKFCKSQIQKRLNISQKMLHKVLNHFDYEVKPLTKNKKWSQEKWIKEATKKHKGFYDYSLVNYVNGSTKVEIICPVHGSFKQNPLAHVNRGDRCFKCSKEELGDRSRTTREEFIRESRGVHGDRYDYSLVRNFKRLSDKVKIICPKHGVFNQTAISHKMGSNCEKCSYESRGNDRIMDPETVLSKFIALNGDEFEYDMSSYKNASTKMRVKCKKHGWFLQSPSKHLAGRKCPSCRDESLGDRTRSNKKEFIQKAREVHGDYYNYDKVVYRRNNIPVDIICPNHGEFKQRTNNHLLGAGCPTCANISSMVKHGQNVPCKIYLLEFSGEESFYKIGITRTINDRLRTLRRESGHKIKKICCIEAMAESCVEVEQSIINKFKSYRYEPLVSFRGHTECFTKDIPIEEVKQLIEQGLKSHKI